MATFLSPFTVWQSRIEAKVASTAAWWLFGRAITSVGVAAFAGVMAVWGLALFG